MSRKGQYTMRKESKLPGAEEGTGDWLNRHERYLWVGEMSQSWIVVMAVQLFVLKSIELDI